MKPGRQRSGRTPRTRKRSVAPAQPTRSPDFSLADYVKQHGGDINEIMANLTAEKARHGDTDSALGILQDFVGAIDQYNERTWHGPIHWAYAHFIADAFEKVVRAAMRSPRWTGAKWENAETGEAQGDANLALGIKSSKAGRRRGAKTRNTEALAALYWFLIRRGFKPERANELLRERIGCDRTTIQKAATHEGNEAYRYPKLNDDETLKRTFEPYAAHAAAIIEQEARRVHSAERRKKLRK